MALTKTQQVIVAKARSVGGGKQGIALDDAACLYLVAVIARDLGLQDDFRELPFTVPSFFGPDSLSSLVISSIDFVPMLERLVTRAPDTETYFHCLATLHKARLKYERILETQPLPTIDQVGPRGLLQYGRLSPRAMTAFLLWRKWIFDIDNRAGQETGYMFEPIIAAAIGGVPVSASKSPVRRQSDASKGRQVDCIRGDNTAYEIKIRLTIAASGQGRWREELDFPTDCRASGYTPVLVVLDPTENPKLDELRRRFLAAEGVVYIGQSAWDHLGSLAGDTMGRFLELYVHDPIRALLAEYPKSADDLSDINMHMSAAEITLTFPGNEQLRIRRTGEVADSVDGGDDFPDDVDE